VVHLEVQPVSVEVGSQVPKRDDKGPDVCKLQGDLGECGVVDQLSEYLITLGWHL
jgi:hypothetical protein